MLYSRQKSFCKKMNKRLSTNNNPIGILDSGVGGLSVWQEVIKTLPHESIIYFGDSANCPYGEKSKTRIKTMTENIIDFLLKKDCKLIIIACNTISVSIIEELRKKYSIPIIAIEPAIKVAAKHTKNKNIGVLATRGTQKGKLYKNTKEKLPKNINIHFQIGKGLVEIVEKGEINAPKNIKLLKKYLNPLMNKNIDQLVLGCTHYPFLTRQIKQITENKINIINPAKAVAKQTKKKLTDHKLLTNRSKPNYTFFTSGKIFLIEKLLPNINLKSIKINLNKKL